MGKLSQKAAGLLIANGSYLEPVRSGNKHRNVLGVSFRTGPVHGRVDDLGGSVGVALHGDVLEAEAVLALEDRGSFETHSDDGFCPNFGQSPRRNSKRSIRL